MITPDLENFLNITPDPRILRMLGEIEITPLQCLCELIDNSIDAFTKEENPENPKIFINLPKEKDINYQPILISDNGCGMDREQLTKSIRAGFSGNNGMDTLGLFGMGFNIATARLGYRTEITTCRKEDDFMLKATIDLRKMERSMDYQAPWVTLPKPIDNSNKHGTEVRIFEIKKDFLTRLRRKQYLAKELGRIYGRIIRDKNINLVYESIICRPFSHFRWSNIRTGKNGAPAYIAIDKTIATQKYCASCFEWLSFQDVICPICKEQKNVISRDKKVKGWIGLQCYFDKKEFGIDLIRNGRVIKKNDKTLFDWADEDDDEPTPEYPLDGQVGGRIIGELEIDFIQVDFLKKSFVTETKDWSDFLYVIRGEGPIRPQIGKRKGFGDNNSPLATIFNAFRRTDPGIDNLVPRIATKRNSGIFSGGQIEELKDKFYNNEFGFQDDSKAYELILRGEKPLDSPISSDDDDEIEEVFGEGGTEATNNGGTNIISEGETSTNNLNTEKEILDEDLSLTYSIDLLKDTKIKVEAYKISKGSNQSGFTIQPQSRVMVFKYWPKSQIFKETFFRLEDFLVNEIAYFLHNEANVKLEDFPLSLIRRSLQKKYFPDLYPEIDFLRQEIDSITESLANHLEKAIKNINFNSKDLSKESIERILKRMSYGTPTESASQMNEIIEKGEFIQFADFEIYIEIFKKFPQILFDGSFFKTKIPSIEKCNDIEKDTIDNALLMFRDILWWQKNGTISSNKIWKARGRRVAGSLEVVRGWQA